MAGVVIDVKREILNFEVGEEKIEFILEKLMRNPSLMNSCYLVDIIDACVEHRASELPLTN